MGFKEWMFGSGPEQQSPEQKKKAALEARLASLNDLRNNIAPYDEQGAIKPNSPWAKTIPHLDRADRDIAEINQELERLKETNPELFSNTDAGK